MLGNQKLKSIKISTTKEKMDIKQEGQYTSIKSFWHRRIQFITNAKFILIE